MRIHCQDRAAAWRRELEQRTATLLATATTPAQQHAIEQSYQQELERGPGFARVHRDAQFQASPTTHRLSTQTLRRIEQAWRFLVRRMTATDRKTPRATGKLRRTLSRSSVDVMDALLYLSRKYPTVFPSIEGLAVLANVCRRTAVTALNQLEAWGFVRIERRRKRIVSPTSGITETQDTSVYILQLPQGLAAMALSIFGWKAECKTCPASTTISNGSAKKRLLHLQPSPHLTPLPASAPAQSQRIPWWAMIKPCY